MALKAQRSATSVSFAQPKQGRRASAGPDEINSAYVKQIVSDWRNSVRERRFTTDLDTTATSSATDLPTASSKKSITTTSIIRPSIQRPKLLCNYSKPVDIEHGKGSAEADRIAVAEGIDLYIHQPIKVGFSKPLQAPQII
ncbi:uncharacterized protein LOC108151725 [Drosophila miranda]|uniref:uncharacterized protein LOC108151725 n=1 Tax=Drosophila miranda TaxID=7229 RepID=UPI0007E77D76|nr:uncharacterized protein LOC108151725 [Drosophila miranda]